MVIYDEQTKVRNLQLKAISTHLFYTKRAMDLLKTFVHVIGNITLNEVVKNNVQTWALVHCPASVFIEVLNGDSPFCQLYNII